MILPITYAKKNYLSKTRFLLCLSIFIAITGHAEQFYKWVDRNGSTHYTKTPPPQGAKSQGQVNTYGHSKRATPNTAQSSTPGSTLPVPATSQTTPAGKPTNNNPAQTTPDNPENKPVRSSTNEPRTP